MRRHRQPASLPSSVQPMRHCRIQRSESISTCSETRLKQPLDSNLSSNNRASLLDLKVRPSNRLVLVGFSSASEVRNKTLALARVSSKLYLDPLECLATIIQGRNSEGVSNHNQIRNTSSSSSSSESQNLRLELHRVQSLHSRMIMCRSCAMLGLIGCSQAKLWQNFGLFA